MSLTLRARARHARLIKMTAGIGGLLAALISYLLFLQLPTSVPDDGSLGIGGSSSTGSTGAAGATPGLSSQDQVAQPAANSLLGTIRTETNPERKAQTLDRIMQSADSDRRQMVEALVTRVDSEAAELRQLLVRRWAEEQPGAAAAWAAHLPEGHAQTEAVSQIALAWAEIDLNAAIAWANSLAENSGKQVALANLAYEAARTAPEVALAIARSLTPNADDDNLVVHAVSQWAAADSSAATAWAEKVPDVHLRQRVIAAVAVALATQDGAAAARLAASELAPGEEQDRAVVAVVQRWAQASPRDAMAWVSQFPNSSLRQAALQSLMALGSAVTSVGP